MYFKLNAQGRDFVVGDLHGYYDLFLEKLEEINFDKDKDRMFSVGDLADRGPKSVECLNLISEKWFHAVMGNHEDMFVNAIINKVGISLFEYNGGDWHINTSYDIKIKLAEMANKLPLFNTIETDNGLIGISHAQPVSNDWNDMKTLDMRERERILWGKNWVQYRNEEVRNVYKTYHGHTPLAKPTELANVNFIDTGAFFSGILTVVQIQ